MYLDSILKIPTEKVVQIISEMFTKVANNLENRVISSAPNKESKGTGYLLSN